ncbi:MAG: IcmL protein [uncultured bacterium]|nr:MAG: IcmL protein [uncultured bacterium]
MAEEEQKLIRLRDDFYRDGFYKALYALVILLGAILLLLSTSIYLLVSKPKPVKFVVGNEFRMVPLVAVSQPYLKQPDLIQWVSDVLPAVFTVDFVNYNRELKNATPYFTTNGWKSFLDQLKMYADASVVANGKFFVNANPAGAPFILTQGLLNEDSLKGIYGWWIQMPVNLSYSSAEKGSTLPLVIQVLVVRVSTQNNLSGVAIENMKITKGSGDQVITSV